MLIYSETRLVPTDINMMTIAVENGGYLYVHRSLYDQAVIINDLYNEHKEDLIMELTGSTESRADVDYMYENTPSPINMLAPFLLWVKGELTEFEDMIGAIHVMSGPVHLRNALKIPREARNFAKFSLSIREEYQLAWDRFFQLTAVYGEQITVQKQEYAPMNGTNTTTEPTGSELTNIGADGEEYEDPLMALLMSPPDDMWDMPAEEPEEDKKEEQPVATPAPAPVVAPVVTPTPEPVPEPAPAPQAKSGLDMLKSGLI